MVEPCNVWAGSIIIGAGLSVSMVEPCNVWAGSSVIGAEPNVIWVEPCAVKAGSIAVGAGPSAARATLGCSRVHKFVLDSILCLHETVEESNALLKQDEL